MTQQADTANKRLHDWFVNFVTYFRTEYERFSGEEKKFMGKWMDCLPPCQIEVFWLKEPEFQLIIKTKFADRQDMEIMIDDPYDSHEFIDKVDVVTTVCLDSLTRDPVLLAIYLFSSISECHTFCDV